MSPDRLPGSPRETLRAALAVRQADRLWLATVAAPRSAPERLWLAAAEATAVLWDPPGGPALAGLGAAVVVRENGAQRFSRVVAGITETTRGWVGASAPAVASPPPAFVGGGAFHAGVPPDEDSTGLPDALLVLPRWTYRVSDEAATLTLAVPPGPLATDVVLAELDAILVALGSPPPAPGDEPARIVEEETSEEWRDRVERAREMILSGSLAKVVLARRLTVRPGCRLDPVTVLERLADEGPGLFRFGLREGRRVFLGASPELLVERREDTVRSVALAGSAPRGDGRNPVGPERGLLGDRKQREEHELVVRWLRDTLSPLCCELFAPAEPVVRALRRVLHLATPFSGRLKRPVSVLDLAARLHPTPAVGGVPGAAAMAAIAALETHSRGWFAGPFGRVEAGGDGELAVALRSALLATEPDAGVVAAHVWAGAGILAASDPMAELEETRLKARTCLHALGVPR